MRPHLNCSRNDNNLKAVKHTQLAIPADCQLDPLHPGQHANGQGHGGQGHLEQSHHSLLPINCDNRNAVDCGNLGDVAIDGGTATTTTTRTSPSGHGLVMSLGSDTLRSTARTRSSRDQMLGDQTDIDDTDPDVIPNQFGKSTIPDNYLAVHSFLSCRETTPQGAGSFARLCQPLDTANATGLRQQSRCRAPEAQLGECCRHAGVWSRRWPGRGRGRRRRQWPGGEYNGPAECIWQRGATLHVPAK